MDIDICTKSIRATREEILRFISTKPLLGCCCGDGSDSVNGFGDGSGYNGDEVVADDVHGSGYNYSSGYGVLEDRKKEEGMQPFRQIRSYRTR